jgi:hypothetical protein
MLFLNRDLVIILSLFHIPKQSVLYLSKVGIHNYTSITTNRANLMDIIFYYTNFIMYNCEYSVQIVKEGKVTVAMIIILYAVCVLV